MNKNRIRKGIAFLVFIILLLWWYGYIPNGAPEKSPQVRVPVPAQSTNATSTPSPPPVPTLSPEEMRKRSEDQVRYQNHVFDLLLLTPIVFYGKVVDEKGTPVEGATVLINPTQGISGDNPEIKKTSDENGLFSIWTHGMGLVVNVSKDGYYRIKESAGMYGYSVVTGGDFKPHTNSKDPAIFVLRKRGDAEPLYMYQCDSLVPKDGTPAGMNLTKGGYGVYEHHGDIQVQTWVQARNASPNNNSRFDWRCLITVPGGGLQPRMGGDFDFTAPTDGYQPSDEINMPASDPQWRESQSREYFLKLANGTYARISFVVGVGGANTFEITSYLNPKPGHRNLEFDPAKQINK